MDVRNLGDILIRQLRNNRKPTAMKFEEYLVRCQEWDRHLDSGYLRFTLACATAQEKVEQIFEHQPGTQKKKYAEKNDDVENVIDKLKSFFVGCHTADLADGTYQTILKSQRAAQAA